MQAVFEVPGGEFTIILHVQVQDYDFGFQVVGHLEGLREINRFPYQLNFGILFEQTRYGATNNIAVVGQEHPNCHCLTSRCILGLGSTDLDASPPSRVRPSTKVIMRLYPQEPQRSINERPDANKG